jgi:hypothetical protein
LKQGCLWHVNGINPLENISEIIGTPLVTFLEILEFIDKTTEICQASEGMG